MAKAGYSRGDIARYLGTSYQFVRNVLVRDETRASGGKTNRDSGHAHAVRLNPHRTQMNAAGQVVIPEEIRTRLGLKEGETLIVTAENDEVRLTTIPVAVRKAQAIVRQYVPEGVSLVDELLEDRRREVEQETQE
ncbi:MAG TPA: AbrB/MazE/SpoVT family DNA-binding domain-containing protein [Hyphomicrobium sp.]|nr:AbrB/MazE/SpoVT family DNA-binding domain-containing protein [Hyphomicrobium sp.]